MSAPTIERASPATTRTDADQQRRAAEEAVGDLRTLIDTPPRGGVHLPLEVVYHVCRAAVSGTPKRNIAGPAAQKLPPTYPGTVTSRDVREIILTIGQWLGQVHGRGVDDPSVMPEEIRWDAMARHEDDQPRLFYEEQDVEAWFPNGKIPAGHGWDEKERAAIANLAVWGVTYRKIRRWMQRVHAQPLVVLSTELALHVWRYVGWGVPEVMPQVCRLATPPNMPLARAFVKVYDRLEFARRDAVSAVQDLRFAVHSDDAQQIRDASLELVERGWWIDPRHIDELRHLMTVDAPTGRVHGWFAQTVDRPPAPLDPVWEPAHVGQLHPHQVQRIAHASGLRSGKERDRARERKLSAAARARGLSAETDLLRPRISAAVQHDAEAALLASVDRMRRGFVDWDVPLQEELSA